MSSRLLPFGPPSRLAEGSADPGLKARALCPLAFLKIMNDARDDARAVIDRALEELPAASQYDLERAECLVWRAGFGYFNGDGVAMIRDAGDALALFDRTPAATRTRKIEALGALAHGYYQDRRNTKAEQAFSRVMGALEETARDRTLAAADALNNWALVYFQGDIARAEPLSRRAVELLCSIERSGSIAPTYTFNLAGVLHRLGRYREAEVLHEETVHSAREREETRVELNATMELAEAYIESGDLSRAAFQLDKLAPFTASPRFDRFRQAQMDYDQGRLAQARGELAPVRNKYRRAIEVFDQGKRRSP